jgi:hypothetical protein
MTIFDEILITANRLANEGKRPTVALVKAKLTQQVSLPTIIKTLKNWQHDADFIAMPEAKEAIKKSDKNNTTSHSNVLQNADIQNIVQQALETELSEIKQDLKEMKDLIKQLSEELK